MARTPLAHLDELGLHLPDYPSVLDHVQTAMRGIYGEDLYLEADSQDGQLAAIFAEAIYDAFNLAGSVYNSFAPSSAKGVSLARQVKINGLRKKTDTHSTVPLRLVGAVGTIINSGIAKDTQQQSWIIPNGTIIPSSGEVYVTATAEQAGAVKAEANTITEIATPQRGWHSVVNASPATVGTSAEKDAELRRRQTRSTALPSRTVLDGIVGGIEALTGVTRVKAYENDTDETDSNGIPRKSISLVVEGGNIAEIANVIASKKGPGCGTYGSTAVVVTDKYGSPITIRFWVSEDAEIAANVKIKPLAGYLATTANKIKSNMSEAIKSKAIGEDVLLSKLYTPINSADAELHTFDIVDITLGLKGGPLTAANVVIPFNQAASLSENDVVVEVING